MRLPLAIMTALLSAHSAPAAIDPAKDVTLFWPAGHEARHLALLREAGVNVVLLSFPGAPTTAGFARACREAGMAAVAYLDGVKDAGEARAQAERAREAGFAGVAVEAAAFGSQQPLGAFVAALGGLEALVFLKPEESAWRVAPAHAVLRSGQWPGVRSSRRLWGEDQFAVASASRDPWLDANSYLVAYLRGLYPDRAAVLGYRPDAEAGVKPDRVLPYYWLELALAESFAAGGNVVLWPPEKHHAALLAGNAEALAAWRALGQTAGFLKQQAQWFRAPAGATVAVAAGTLDESGEILNMLYRRNACPAVFAAAQIPPLDPARWRVVVAANVPVPSEAGRRRLLDYARGGGLLMVSPAAAGDPAWWLTSAARKTREEEDRHWYALGKGTVVAYREPVEDPHELALDVIDAVGIGRRDLRMWNAGTLIGLLNRVPDGQLVLTLINYGSPRRDDFPVRLWGRFRKATLHEPAAPPRPLGISAGARGTEITVDRLGRLAVILLE